jgi:hypothetical protein
MLKVGDRVRLTESARAEMLAYREEGSEKEVIQKNRVGTVLDQVGVRGRHLVIAFHVDFGGGVVVLLPEEYLEMV